MKHFAAEKTPDGFEILVLDTTYEGGGYRLDPRHDLRYISTEMNWETGTGRSQLALALLADVLGVEPSHKLFTDFKLKFVSRLEGDQWSISEEDVRLAVAQIESQKGMVQR